MGLVPCLFFCSSFDKRKINENKKSLYESKFIHKKEKGPYQKINVLIRK